MNTKNPRDIGCPKIPGTDLHVTLIEFSDEGDLSLGVTGIMPYTSLWQTIWVANNELITRNSDRRVIRNIILPKWLIYRFKALVRDYRNKNTHFTESNGNLMGMDIDLTALPEDGWTYDVKTLEGEQYPFYFSFRARGNGILLSDIDPGWHYTHVSGISFSRIWKIEISPGFDGALDKYDVFLTDINGMKNLIVTNEFKGTGNGWKHVIGGVDIKLPRWIMRKVEIERGKHRRGHDAV